MTDLRITLGSIDRHSFKVQRVGEEVMIQPLKTKARWSDEELPWRSLVTDPDGRVVSAAWPKFFNHGEHAPHDADFVRALGAGEVSFVEKLDGTLIVVDVMRDGVRLRTRGQTGLGEFERPVRRLVEQRYPGLLTWRERDLGDARGHSLLFEYVSPEHTIVRYRKIKWGWTSPALSRPEARPPVADPCPPVPSPLAGSLAPPPSLRPPRPAARTLLPFPAPSRADATPTLLDSLRPPLPPHRTSSVRKFRAEKP